MPTYPSTPGAKVGGTSAEAAKRMSGIAEIMRMRCLGVLKRHQLTADEIAELLGETVLSVRPRVSELKRLGEIVATGARRPNLSGHMATVWKSTQP